MLFPREAPKWVNEANNLQEKGLQLAPPKIASYDGTTVSDMRVQVWKAELTDSQPAMRIAQHVAQDVIAIAGPG